MKATFLLTSLLSVGSVLGGTYYASITDANRSNFTMWTADGVVVSESTVQNDSWCDLVITNMYGANIGPSGTYKLNSLTLDYKNVGSSMLGGWSDGGQVFILGAGGLVAKPNCDYRFCRNNHFVALQLNASQTWYGADSGTAYGAIGFGYGGYDYPNRGRVRIEALSDLTWTLSGRIYVSLADTNLLTKADVVVNDKARLYFIGNANGAAPSSGALNAKSLTLNGDGSGEEMLIVGTNNGYLHAYGKDMAAPKEFDDGVLAPVVTLHNGASVKGGTVDYALTQLNVTGGTSTFSGDVTVTKPAAITIASGAQLTFTGSLATSGDGALTVSGDGALGFVAGLHTAKLVGSGLVVVDPGATGETVFTGDLSHFTGTIRALSGSALIAKTCHLSPAATLEAAAGAVCREMTDDDYGEYTRNGCTYWRAADGRSHLYLFCNPYSGNIQWAGVSFRTNATVTTDKLPWVEDSVFVYDTASYCGLTFNDNHVHGILYKVANGREASYLECAQLTLGALGIHADAEVKVPLFIHGENHVHLAESQTWSGKAVSTLSDTPFVITAGPSKYGDGGLVADAEGLAWTLAGDLFLQLGYYANDLSGTDVRVVAPAKLAIKSLDSRGDGQLNARKLTLDGGAGITFGPESGKWYSLGSLAEISPTRVARTIALTNGATLKATQKTTWTGTGLVVEGTDTATITGAYEMQDAETAVLVPANATLDLSAATFTAAANGEAVLNVTGAGTLVADVSHQDWLKMNGATLKIVGKGTWHASVADVAALEIAGSGYVALSTAALQGYAGAAIVVSSGTLVIDEDAALPAGIQVVTSGSGGLVVVDPSGFDKDARMGGTQNLVSSKLIVTEALRENETIDVGNGEELAVFGSGLQASSVVKSAAGATITFYKNAQIAAPIEQQGATEINFADTNLVATIAGKYLASGKTRFTAAANRLVFTAGALFSNSVDHVSGMVELTSGTYVMGAVSVANYNMYSGRLVVKDGGFLKDGHVQCCIYANLADQTGDVVLEVGENGTVQLGNSGILYLGKNANYESRLILNGGTIFNWAGDATPRLCDGGTGKAAIEINAGVLKYREMWAGNNSANQTGVSKFIWRGGTIGAENNTYKGNHLFAGKGALDFVIDGTNCIFDARSVTSVITNFLSEGTATFRATAGSRLKVIGASGTRRKLCLRDCGDLNGLGIDLSATPSADVEIVGTGSAVNVGWVLPGGQGKVRCTGTASPLVATCIVPPGLVFTNAMFDATTWHEGFSSVVSAGLRFELGAVYQLTPVNRQIHPLVLTGALTLPSAMTLTSSAFVPTGLNQPVIETVDGVLGSCVWTFGKGVKANVTTLKISDDGKKLLLDRKSRGFLVEIN